MKFTAPCGHVGEPIIGTFVRCLSGCDSVKKTAARRGRPGHQDACACKPCQVHRKVTTIVLRSDKGDELARVPWNGLGSRVTGVTRAGEVRHFKLLDANGDVVVEKPLSAQVFNGPVHIEINWLMDLVSTLSITQPRLRRQVQHDAWMAFHHGLNKYNPDTATGEALDRLAELTGTYRQPGGGTYNDIKLAVMAVPGVLAVKCTSVLPGMVSIEITGTEQMNMHATVAALETVCPAGISYQVSHRVNFESY